VSALPGIVDDSWWQKAIDRSHAIYPNEGVRPTASLMARTGRYAADYLEQAPAILAYVTWGHLPHSYADRALVAQRFGTAVHHGPRLKEMMAEFHAPQPLRKLTGSVVIPSNLTTIIALRNVPPSALSQAIPEGKLQLKWMRCLREWRSESGRMPYMVEMTEAWNWAVVAISNALRDGVPNVDRRIRDLHDFFVRGRAKLNPEWTFRAALAAAERWHAELAAKADHEQFLQQHGFRFDQERDYSPLPSQAEVDGFTFIALTSGLTLFIEGRAMRHCVASYVREVMLGGTRIYSVKKGEDRVATLELRPLGERFIQGQLKGPCNSHPNKPIREAAALFLGKANAEIRRRAA
jgi:hypothetical protein